MNKRYIGLKKPECRQKGILRGNTVERGRKMGLVRIEAEENDSI